MALTDAKIRAAKAQKKLYKLSDEKGLLLIIKPNNGKYWRLKYRFNGKEKSLALGVYPEVTLSEARDKRDKARKLLTNKVDPGLLKQINQRAKRVAAENTFEAIAREWFVRFSSKWKPEYRSLIIRRLENYIFPWLGKRPISEISPSEILSALHRIEDFEYIDTAHRVRQICGQIFRYAVVTTRANNDPTRDLRGALKPIKTKNFATITEPVEIGTLLRVISSYKGYFTTQCALRLAPLLFVRPGELRQAEWSEFNLENGEWRIPPQKMKAKRLHIVPLPTQAISILKELQRLTANGKYVFPCVRKSANRPMSDNTVNGALRRLGYEKDQITGHGFRAMASTILHEQGWNTEVIERQLAHRERNKVKAAYNHAEYLSERRKLMQHWADYLDSLVMEKNKQV